MAVGIGVRTFELMTTSPRNGLLTAAALIAAMTLTGCSASESSTDTSTSSTAQQQSPAAGQGANTPVLSEEEQGRQDQVLNASGAELGSSESPLTPNVYADLTSDPKIFAGNVPFGVGHTILITVRADAPGKLAFAGVKDIKVTEPGYISLAVPVTEAKSYEVTYTYATGESLKIATVIAR